MRSIFTNSEPAGCKSNEILEIMSFKTIAPALYLHFKNQLSETVKVFRFGGTDGKTYSLKKSKESKQLDKIFTFASIGHTHLLEFTKSI